VYASADLVVSGGEGIPIIASMTEQGDTAPSTSLTLNKPSGVESGDLLLLIVMNDDRSATAFSDNKNGWSFLNTSGDASSQAHVAVFWKIADGTEGPTETVTSAGSDEWMGYYLRITGADSTTPINANNFAQSSANSANHIIPAVTTTIDDCLVLYGLSFDGGDGYPFSVSGAGWSEEDEHQTGASGSGDVSGCFGSKNLTSQGSSGSATVSCALSDGAAYFQLAIAPSDGGSSSTESNYLRTIGFDFSNIPDGAVIEGITVEIDKHANVTDSIKDYSIQLRNSTGLKGVFKVNASFWSLFDTYSTYGGPNDLWSASWTATEIKSASFGVDIVVDTSTSAGAFIDHVRIKVNYTASLSGESWQNPSKTTSQDNDNAYISFSSATENTSDWLRVINFGFTIPDTAEITGIEIRMDRDSNVSNTIKDAEIYLRYTTGPVGDNISNGLWWDTIGDNNYDVYGGSSELWGASWNYAEINSPDFGIDLFIRYFDTVPVNACIDHLQIKVHYNESPQSQEAWINSDKAIDQDNDDTFVSFNTGTENSSDWLRLTDFGFSIPTEATILGIRVEMDRRSTLTDSIWDGSVFLRKILGQVGNTRAMGGYWDTIDNDGYDSYGGSTDLWNTTWSVADINSADFGVELFVNSSGLVTTEARIDHIRITIYYSTPSSEIVIVDNKFTVDVPSLPFGEELCSIEGVRVNGTSYDYSYFVDAVNGTVLITLLTPVELDGSYDNFSPVFLDIGVSNATHCLDQFVGSFDFTQLPQDNYMFIGEFYDITGEISQFVVNGSVAIDFHGPQIYGQFVSNSSIDPESSSISFVVNDLSGVSHYYFNATIDGYWTVVDNYYTFTFNDSNISEGTKYITFTCNDTLGLESEYIFVINLDKTEPVISGVSTLSSYWTNLYEINASITDFSGFSLTVEALHLSSGVTAYGLDYTIFRKDGTWTILISSEGLQNGYYNLTLVATDNAGNIATYTVNNVYLDSQFSEIESIQEQIFAESENVYNNTITDYIYFSDEKYLEISAFDELFDGFDWSQIDSTIDDQLGLKNISLYYTNPLNWHNISILGALNYETLHYKITGYGDPLNTDLMNVKSIQQLKIGNYIIDKFTVLLDGASLTIKIDEQYRYLLSPYSTDQIFAQFYELVADKIFLTFNSSTKKWELLSSGENYFNISDYLALTEEQEFLLWFEVEDGLGNVLQTHKYKGVYDNAIVNSPQSESLFEWSLGTNSTGAGIIIFGSDEYSDSTIQVNVSSIVHTLSGQSDVGRIMVYGSETGTSWDFIGRAYFSGEENVWNYYWDGDQIEPMLPESYYLKIRVFDRAGNYLTQTNLTKLYDYTQVVLLTDVVFGHVFEYNASLISNPQTIEGIIDNYFQGSSEALWDVIAEWYNPNKREWIPLAFNSSTILANGDSATYTITWDISKDLSFVNSMYENRY